VTAVKKDRGSVARFEEYVRHLGSANGADSRATDNAMISGSARLSGFSGRSLDISGSAEIQGDVSVDSLLVSGSARIDGSLRASNVAVSGSCLVKGKADCVNIDVSGSMRLCGDASLGKNLIVVGSAKVEGSLQGRNLRCDGFVQVGRDLFVRNVEVSGSVRVGGVTKADRMHVRVHGSDSVFDGEIEAGDVKIELGGRPSRLRILGVSMGGRGRAHVKAPSIRCTGDVDIEQTICSYVEGSKVRIGPGCKIGRVVYRRDVVVEEGAELESEPERI